MQELNPRLFTLEAVTAFILGTFSRFMIELFLDLYPSLYNFVLGVTTGYIALAFALLLNSPSKYPVLIIRVWFALLGLIAGAAAITALP